MPIRAAPKGPIANLINDVSEIKDSIIPKGKLKIAVRTLTYSSASTATVTNAADINGYILGTYQSAGTAWTACPNVSFNSATGAITGTHAAAQTGSLIVLVLQA